MTVIDQTFILLFGSLVAGFLGALSGLGGGIVIVPLLVLGLNVDIHYAIGSSVIAVIATSTASSCAYVKEGYANVRIGILLETATTVGAIFGITIASKLEAPLLGLFFGAFLFYCAVSAFCKTHVSARDFSLDPLSTTLRVNGFYPTREGLKGYSVHHIPFGYLIMLLAGGLSGMLGIGSGALKVVALDQVMGLPFKVSTTTSNFMIGVTAAASAGTCLRLGYIDPILTMPIVLGVVLGSLIGARLFSDIRTGLLRQLFAYLLIVIALQMIWQAFSKGVW